MQSAKRKAFSAMRPAQSASPLPSPSPTMSSGHSNYSNEWVSKIATNIVRQSVRGVSGSGLP